MRTLFFVILFLLTGIVSHAQHNRPKDKVPTTEKGLALAKKTLPAHQQQSTEFYYDLRYTKGSETTTIYKYRNTKIKRALLFMIKGVRPKLA